MKHLFFYFYFFLNFFFFLIFSTGSHSHRRDESDIFGGWHANPFAQFVQRQQSVGRLTQHVPEPECQRSHIGAAFGPRIWPGGHIYGIVEQCVLQNAGQTMAAVICAIVRVSLR